MGPASDDGGDDAGVGLDWAGLPSPELVRAAAGLAVAAVVALLGGFILGEYEFDGWLPLGAGVLFGLVVAEVAVGIGRRRTLPIGLAAGAFAAGGLVWAGWISSGEGLEPMQAGVWAAAGLAVVAAAVRTVGRRAKR